MIGKAGTVLRVMPPFLAGGLAFGLYLATCATTITWKHGGSDGGELSLAAARLGVAHPTGYPLYLMLAQLFLRLPWPWVAEVAGRMALYSAFSAALAVTFLYLAALTLLRLKRPVPGWRDNIAACLAALALATAPLYWSQAVIAEVYNLGNALLALALFLAVRLRLAYSRNQQGKSWALGLALLSGLAVGHERVLIFSLPGLVLLAGFREPAVAGGLSRTVRAVLLRPKPVMLALSLFGLGLMGPYLYQWARETAVPEASWGDFWWNFSGQGYARILFAATPGETFGRLSAAARTLLEQGGPAGFLWLAGLAGGASGRFQPGPVYGAALLASGLYLLFTVVYPADNSPVYLLPALPWLALLLAPGWRELLELSRGKAFFSGLIYGLAALVIVWPVLAGLAEQNLKGDSTAREWAVKTLEAAPAGALLVTGQDEQTFSLWYAQELLAQRPDVAIVDHRLLVFNWYQANLRRMHPGLLPLDCFQSAVDLAKQVVHPVIVVCR